MPEISKLESPKLAIQIQVAEGEIVHLMVRADLITGKAMKNLTQPETGAQVDAMFDLLCNCVTSWDITEGGIEMAITKEALESLPISFTSSILRKVMETLNPQPTNNGSFVVT